MRKAFSIFSVLIFCFSIHTYAHSTEKSKLIKSMFINRDTVWKNNIIVDGVVKVSEGVTLKLLPWTKVHFSKHDRDNDGVGDSGISLQGNILALGTSKQPIIFTTKDANNREPGDWAGINIIASDISENIFSNVIIEYANTGIHSHFSTLSLKNCTFINNRRGLYCQEMRLEISNTKFIDNISGIRSRNLTGIITKTVFENNIWGMDCRNVICTFYECEFNKNKIYGLRSRESGIRLTESSFNSNRFGGRFQDSVTVLYKVKSVNNFESGVSFNGGNGEISESIFEKNGLEGINGKDVFLIVNDSSFKYNRFGIRCKGKSNLIIENSIFSKNNEGIGVNTDIKQGSFYGNNLKINSNGLGCRFSNIASFYLNSSEIKSNTKEGVKAKKTSGKLRNTSVTGNIGDGVSLSSSSVNFQKSTVSKNKGWGIYSLRSNAIISNMKLVNNYLGGFKGIFGQASIVNTETIENIGHGYYFEQCKILLEKSSAKRNGKDGIFLDTSVATIKKFTSRSNIGWGVKEKNSRMHFEDGELLENGMGGLLSDETENSHIIHSTFINNLEGWSCDSCEETLFVFNKVEGNTNYGVKIKDASPTIRYNSLTQKKYNLIINGEEDIDVSDNFWGSVDDVQIERGIIDVLDNSGNGAAQYIPYLKSIPKYNYEQTEIAK